MTATSLFDLLARLEPASAPPGRAGTRLARFAGKLVECSLADLERLREYEQEFANPAGEDDDGLTIELLRSVWQLYAEWATEAELVLARVRPLRSTVSEFPGLARLEDAYGAVRARLSVPPEQIMAGKDQVRRGEVVSAGELRDELRARRRA